jgi:hypothetical protein
LRSGLVENQDRRMTSTVEGISRLFRESLTLEAPATNPG